MNFAGYVVIKLRRQCYQVRGNSIQVGRGRWGNVAISAHVPGLQFHSGNVNKCQSDVQRPADGNGGRGTLNAQTIQNTGQLNPDAGDVVFDYPALRWRDIQQVIRENLFGIGDSERIFHIGEQFVNVPTGDRQAASV